MSIGTIYLIINRTNGLKYVGETTIGTNKAWKQHIDESKRMSPLPLHRAMRKDGNHNFMLREIEECNINQIEERLQHYILEYGTHDDKQGYNHDINIEEKKEIIEPVPIKKKETWGFHLEKNRGNGKHLAAKVLSVNVETGEEKLWNSITEASIGVTGNRNATGNITNAMKNGHKAYGYLWRRMTQSTRNTKVYGINKITWMKTQVYPSIKSAARDFGCPYTSDLRKSLNNPRKYSWKGFYWFKE